jgi:hypothetical protein
MLPREFLMEDFIDLGLEAVVALLGEVVRGVKEEDLLIARPPPPLSPFPPSPESVKEEDRFTFPIFGEDTVEAVAARSTTGSGELGAEPLSSEVPSLGLMGVQEAFNARNVASTSRLSCSKSPD